MVKSHSRRQKTCYVESESSHLSSPVKCMSLGHRCWLISCFLFSISKRCCRYFGSGDKWNKKWVCWTECTMHNCNLICRCSSGWNHHNVGVFIFIFQHAVTDLLKFEMFQNLKNQTQITILHHIVHISGLWYPTFCTWIQVVQANLGRPRCKTGSAAW